MIRALFPVALVLTLAGCGSGEPTGPDAPLPTELSVLEAGHESAVAAPNSSMRLVSKGDGEVLVSAGFFNRNELARIGLPARVAWAPGSQRLFINDPGNAALGRVRVFEVTSNGRGAERADVHRAAVAELVRMNGCTAAPESDVATDGIAWAAEGAQLYVRAEVRRRTGDCPLDQVSGIIAVVDVEGGRLLEALPADEARRRHPELPGA